MGQERRISSDGDGPAAGTWGIWNGWTPTSKVSVLHRGDEGYPLAEVGQPPWPPTRNWSAEGAATEDGEALVSTTAGKSSADR